MCKHRGPLLLHAAKSWDKTAADWMHERGLAPPPGDYLFRCRRNHREGVIFARCRVVGSVDPMGWCSHERLGEDRVGFDIGDAESGFDARWWMGGHGLLIENVEPTPLVACKGSLGLWTVPADALAQLGAA